MKMNLLITAGAFIFLSTALLTGCTQKTSQPALDNAQASSLFMKVPKAEHEKMFPQGHKQINGKECIFDREIDAYFCQYWDKYDGYAPK
jgi:hypothetical protein